MVPTVYVEENALLISSSVGVPCSFTLGANRFQKAGSCRKANITIFAPVAVAV
jgi:hypothetical protein